jgi:RHS repeat-associated protein
MASVNEMQFSSMPWHDGILFLPRRPYLPDIGRFATQDPIQEAGGINLYEFVGNNPVNKVDPFGLQSTYFDSNYGDISSYSSPQAYAFWGAVNQYIGEHMPMPGNGVVGGELEGPLMSAMKDEAPGLISALKGSLNAATKKAASCGSKLHADRPGNLPGQLRNKYPETQFKFTPPGVAGPDVQVTGGMHPSFLGDWPEGVDFGDFKPDTAGGLRTFNSDSQNKWNVPVTMITYDPATGTLTTR